MTTLADTNAAKIVEFDNFLEGSSKLQAFAPGRTELAGNHVDHQGGVILAGTIAQGMHARAAENGTDLVRVVSEGFEPFAISLHELRSTKDAAPDPAEFFTTKSLAKGMILVMEAKAADTAVSMPTEAASAGSDSEAAGEGAAATCEAVRGFDLQVSSTLPVGGGLSSSAAFEMLLGVVLNKMFFGDCFDTMELPAIGQDVEARFFGKPTGRMDQTVIAAGGVVVVDFFDDANTKIKQLTSTFADFGMGVCLVDTHTDHSVNTELFNMIPGEMWDVAKHQGVERLEETPAARTVSEHAQIRDDLGDRPFLRALHYHREVELVRKRAAALEAGDMATYCLGTALSGASSAQYLQNVSDYSAQQPAMVAMALCDYVLDQLAGSTLALDERGVARIHGGGFGGTIQVYVPLDKIEAFAAKMDELLGEGSTNILEFTSKGAYAEWL